MKKAAIEAALAGCVGLDLYRARGKLARDLPFLTQELRYVERTDVPRFTVLKAVYREASASVELEAVSENPLRHLPANYQSNDFLRGFLMLFQHIMNETSMTLDNLHHYFRPMESPERFLPSLAQWLGLRLDTLSGEAETRRFLQYAIPLYRYRGTARGLRTHLYIVAQVLPVILEGAIPYSAMMMTDNAAINAHLFEQSASSRDFTVHFPVPRDHFDDAMIRRLSLIVQREKPAHTRAYLSFADAARSAAPDDALAPIEWVMSE
ncbi:MAG: phage tail protein [Treponema sp.]|jgi:phage tail-like protein|nr:phage tail protein [Treponema sp.]